MRRMMETGPELTDDALVRLRRAPRSGRADGHRPWVRAVFISSADGAGTLDGRSGGLGTAADRRQFQLARHDADVVLVGAGTVRAEGYEGALLPEHVQAARAEQGLAPHPPVAVVSGSLDLEPAGAFFRQAPTRPIVLTTERARTEAAARAAALEEMADVVVAGREQVEADLAVQALQARGVQVIHCEGGPRLFGSLAAAGLVDELILSLAPMLAGGRGPRILTDDESGPALPADLRLDHVLHEDGLLVLRYLRAPSALRPG